MVQKTHNLTLHRIFWGRPRVVSGDKDGVILVWDISAELRGSSKDIAPTTRFEGHSATVRPSPLAPASRDTVLRFRCFLCATRIAMTQLVYSLHS